MGSGFFVYHQIALLTNAHGGQKRKHVAVFANWLRNGTHGRHQSHTKWHILHEYRENNADY
jgi:hypothetical protein